MCLASPPGARNDFGAVGSHVLFEPVWLKLRVWILAAKSQLQEPNHELFRATSESLSEPV